MANDQSTFRKVEVDVKVQLPNGLLVQIVGSNREGFLPLRELSWDRSVTFQPQLPPVGARIEAALRINKRRTRYEYLSIRQLFDPWQNTRQHYTVGDIVRGEVVNLRRFAAFVQLEPGITAIARLNALPSNTNQLPEDLLSLGDQVIGVIKVYDREQQQCELSLLDYLIDLPVLLDERIPVQLQAFPALTAKALTAAAQQPMSRSENTKGARTYHPPLERLEQILVVDDDPAECQRLQAELADFFVTQGEAVRIDVVHTDHEALHKIASGGEYDLALIDVRLGKSHGVTVAEALLALLPDMRIIFISSDPRAAREIHPIDGRMHLFAYKRWPEILDKFEMIRYGHWDGETAEKAAFVGRGTFIQQLEMDALERRSLPEALHNLVEKLRLETGATYGLVLESDASNKLAYIVTTSPDLPAELIQRSQDGLYYSPLREVVEHETVYSATKRHDRDNRFRYFFPLLPFRACYGIPLTVAGLTPRYALFLLDEERTIFSDAIIQQVALTAGFMKMAIERAQLLDYMHRYEERYSQGQLLGSLVHELRTKLNGLNTQVARLAGRLAAADYSKAQDAAQKIAETKNELWELIESYSRMAKGDVDAVDINVVIKKVVRQLETRAKEARVAVTLDLQAEIGRVNAIQSRLEQVVLNVLLNAIQQIEHQAQVMAHFTTSDLNRPLLQDGFILIKTLCAEADVNCMVRIIVVDSGPGIHFEQQERIFLLDTSTRATGHGLGLFISRNLIETIGGRLYLADSVIFVGSIFVIELPQFRLLPGN